MSRATHVNGPVRDSWRDRKVENSSATLGIDAVLSYIFKASRVVEV